MYGLPLTINEIAAKIAREIAELRQLGVVPEMAVRVVADRHRIPTCAASSLLIRNRRNEIRRAEREAAA